MLLLVGCGAGIECEGGERGRLEGGSGAFWCVYRRGAHVVVVLVAGIVVTACFLLAWRVGESSIEAGHNAAYGIREVVVGGRRSPIGRRRVC